MRFRRLVIHIQTTDGPYGATLDFPDGLVVVWADNSMGKSTCVKAILIALGMEAMLTTSRSELPLPPAVTARLLAPNGEHDVLESEVLLEIENRHGKRIVTQRSIKGSLDKDLIRVFDGPVLTTPGTAANVVDLFVNLAGGATREMGFHYFLAKFLDWELPTVQTFDGSEKPLYLQSVFPYFVVEQTRGWSTIQPPLPTQFRIRDAHKRAVEFLLNLDAHRVALRRQEILFQKSKIESEWSSRVLQVTDLAEAAAGAVQSLPRNPTSSWPPQIPPSFVVPSGQNWMILRARIEANIAQLNHLVEQEIPRVQEIASSAQAELEEAERDTREKQTLLSRLLDALETEQQEVLRIEQRLAAIDEDIQRNKDVRTLQKLGSRQGSSLDAGNCPICHQSIHDSLVPFAAEQAVMTLEENIQFLNEQKRTFELVLTNSRRIADGRASQVRALNQQVVQTRDTIRSLKQTLLSDGRLPSAAAIRVRIELENSIRKDEMLLSQFMKLLSRFDDLADRWAKMQAELLSLPKEDVTAADNDKIAKWAQLIRAQLTQYGFQSFAVGQVLVSPDTYRPEHEGFDIQTRIGMEAQKNQNFSLQTSISASDLIRTIWSYLYGMLELARTQTSNHPGCIIFDEPRQQSTRDVSFSELLRRASATLDAKQQAIFFTSENIERLKLHLQPLAHSLIQIEGRVFQRIETPPLL